MNWPPAANVVVAEQKRLSMQQARERLLGDDAAVEPRRAAGLRASV
jgi:hypothetical protein